MKFSYSIYGMGGAADVQLEADNSQDLGTAEISGESHVVRLALESLQRAIDPLGHKMTWPVVRPHDLRHALRTFERSQKGVSVYVNEGEYPPVKRKRGVIY